MRLVIAFLCSALAFLVMPFERLLPIPPTPEKLAEGMPPLTWKTAFHHAKNIWTESLRADPQYWGKALAFTICCLIGVAVFT